MKFTLPLLTVAIAAAVDCLGANVAARDTAPKTINISQLQCLEDGEGTPFSNCVSRLILIVSCAADVQSAFDRTLRWLQVTAFGNYKKPKIVS
jgi:hypothetical protein